MIVCHISTSSGPRWSYHQGFEEFRQDLIEYFNETLADDDTPKLAATVTIDTAIFSIWTANENVHFDEPHGVSLDR